MQTRSVPEQLGAALERRRWRPEDLAATVSVPTATVEEHLAGATAPSTETLQVYAGVLGLEEAGLLASAALGEGPPVAEQPTLPATERNLEEAWEDATAEERRHIVAEVHHLHEQVRQRHES